MMEAIYKTSDVWGTVVLAKRRLDTTLIRRQKLGVPAPMKQSNISTASGILKQVLAVVEGRGRRLGK